MSSQHDDEKWWEYKGDQLAQNIHSFVEHLDKSQQYRSTDNLKHARLYGNYEISGLDAYSYTRVESSLSVMNKVTLNIVQNMIDTVVSKITKNKPRPRFLTDGGDWSLKTKAKKLTKFIDGAFNQMEYYKKAVLAYVDACIFGTGCIKFFVQDGKITCEKVFIEELKVDDVESYYGKPRQIHQVKFIHKDVLIQMFPKSAVIIEQNAGDSSEFRTNVTQKSRHMMKVTESWHLPSGKNAKDGLHAITIQNHTLFREQYTKKYFPFVFFRWTQRPVGFFGQGLAEQLKGLQLEINKILRTIQVAMHLVSVPKLLVEASSKIVTAHLNNKIGGIIKYSGTPPTYTQLGSIPPDLFNHLDRLYQRSFEIAGISQLSSQSLKPAGLDSGKALREFNDIESERFLATSVRYEESFIEAAEIIIDMARDLYTKNKEFAVKAKGSKFIETIKWKDVDMDEDAYMMDIFAASYLSKTPHGRLADVEDLIKGGFIDQETGLQLLDFPDLEGTMNMLNADSQNLERVIEHMMDTGKYVSPEPYQNLENAVRKVQQAYLMFTLEGAPDDRLELLRQYMEDSQGLLIKAQQTTATPQQLTEQLAEAGAGSAAQTVAEQANLGAQSPNMLTEGAIPLSPEAVPLPPDEEELPPIA